MSLKYLKAMKSFLKKLLSGQSDEVSSKRFFALIGMALISIMAIASLFNIKINMDLFYSILGLVFSMTGVSAISKIK